MAATTAHQPDWGHPGHRLGTVPEPPWQTHIVPSLNSDVAHTITTAGICCCRPTPAQRIQPYKAQTPQAVQGSFPLAPVA